MTPSPKPHAAAKGAHKLARPVAHLPRHFVFYLALATGLVAFFATVWIWPAFAISIGAIAMFVVYLGLVALMMPALSAQFLRDRSDEADTPVALIFGAVLIVVGVCCVNLFMALNGRGGPLLVAEISLAIASVLMGWFTIHTMAALHYAFEYYQSEAGKGSGGKPVGGLEFPEGDSPDGLAFLYFAYVIGVAFAVSDIRVMSRKMRRSVLLHATFAYFFNTLIVAATVNVVVAVGNG